MSFQSKWRIQVPPVDVLSYIFDKSTPFYDIPVFQNAEDPTEKITKSELEVLTRKLGKGLKTQAGLQGGDVVLACAHNAVLYPAVYLGTICAGGIFSGSNPSSTTLELSNHLRIIVPKVIFTDLSALHLVVKTLEEYPGSKPIVYLMEDKRKYGTHRQYKHLEDLLQYGEQDWERLEGVDIVSKRVAILAFSSGTTGLPKACAISHHNLVACAEQKFHFETRGWSSERRSRYALEHRYCAYLPMYHATGLIMNVHINSKTGASTFVLTGYTLQKLIRAIWEHQITDLLIVPPIAVQLIKCGLDLTEPLASIRRITSGAASLGAESAAGLKKIVNHGNVFIQQAWGMTEATAGATFTTPEHTDGDSVGYLLANMEAKVVDANGNTVGFGKPGEAMLRGPNVFTGYWKDPGATERTRTTSGWLRTGDTVVVDSSHSFKVVGREKELIKVKGFQVSPGELESVLLNSKYVKDCAVIAVKRNGFEHPQAHIVRTDPSVTEADILEFMDKRLSPYKKLTGGIVFTDSIPKSPSGKILRRMITDPWASKRDLQAQL